VGGMGAQGKGVSRKCMQRNRSIESTKKEKKMEAFPLVGGMEGDKKYKEERRESNELQLSKRKRGGCRRLNGGIQSEKEYVSLREGTEG